MNPIGGFRVAWPGSRLATIGLALVLISLTSFSLWAAFRGHAGLLAGATCR